MGFEVGIGGGEEGAGDEHWEMLIGRKSPGEEYNSKARKWAPDRTLDYWVWVW